MPNLLETNIKIVRLQSGEDIIADCMATDDDEVISLKQPMHIIFKRISTGRSVMMMMPWLPVELIKENIANIYGADILTMIDPKDDLIEYYHNSVNDEDMTSATSASIRPQLFGDDEEPTDEELDEEELDELIEEKNQSRIH
mgnify:CR=1 FL=1|tara:strand:+ start:503 stop:928 length:426 start_codon:yes stop_codon:yes gene_type:complete